MRFSHRTILVIAAVSAAIGLAVAAPVSASGTIGASEDQSSLVEDFTYPGAEGILASDGVQLLSGDGHIVYNACPVNGPDTVGLILVSSSELIGPTHNGHVCFKVIGTAGRLTLKIPAVFSIKGDGLAPGQGHKLQAQLTTDAGQHSTVTVNPSGTTQVGITTNPPGEATTLLELDASS